MKSFKKISLKGITEILSEKEMKNVMGGSGSGSNNCPSDCKGGCSIDGMSGGTCAWTNDSNGKWCSCGSGGLG